MNRHKLADERSRAYHKKIVSKLLTNPRLWMIPKRNIQKWKRNMGDLPPALNEWERILTNFSREEILAILESDSEEAKRLRSSSPFTGILTEAERKKILETFRQPT